ncbi:hypothetical protein L7F22_004283 [Adiantum nelumboides]|nr:hypothetical protein [Adiantum nelumboides]
MQAIQTVQSPLPNNLYASRPKACNDGQSFAACTNLRWSTGCDEGMGGFRASIETRRVLSHAVGKNLSTAAPVRAAFTTKQETLVKDTWAILKKDAARHGLALFLTVFEIAPAAKKLFSFLKDSDVPLEKNPKLKAHALQVFVVICEAASSLSKKGQVLTPGSTLKDMAHAHVVSGVVDEHYDVVRYSLLKTVQAGIGPEMWNEEVKNAWGDAYDELVLAIKAQEEYPTPS